MNRGERTPVAVAAGESADKPYTRLGDREEEVVSSAEMTAIRALDRKLTDGLNLVHGQFAVLRAERQEDREEFREFRSQHREEFKELKAEIARVDARAEQRTKELEARFEQRLTEVDARAEQRTKELEARFDQRFTQRGPVRTTAGGGPRAEQRTKELEGIQRFAAVDVRLDRLENALLELTAQINKSLERSFGTLRLAWGVLGAIGLLFAGGLIRVHCLSGWWRGLVGG